MKRENLLLTLSVIILVFSVGAAVFTYFTTPGGYSVLTGWATSTSSQAYINLSVERALALNFTVYNLSLGSGRVLADNATINTATCTIVGGNWSNASPAMGMGISNPGACGFRLENLGNTDLYNLSFTATQSARDWLGGTNPILQLNITNNETSGTSFSCRNLTASNGVKMKASGYQLGSWFDVNTTEFVACDIFNYSNSNDVVRVDVLLVIPSDTAISGETGNVITAIGYA